MLYKLEIYFFMFMCYACFGWILEVTGKLIECKRFINRGFLIGPYCPIYGVGAILITLFLDRYKANIEVLFVMSVILCGVLEYLTSYAMEKIFKARWWDYTRRKFNINGRVCLDTIIPFGILGCFIMYVSNPFILNCFYSIPTIALHIICSILLILFIIDNIVSFRIIFDVRKTTTEVNKEHTVDNTEEITRKVKEILKNKSYLTRRLMDAFPKIEAIKQKIKENIKEL